MSVDLQAPTAVSLNRFAAGETSAPLPASVPMALAAATGLAIAGAFLLRRRKP